MPLSSSFLDLSTEVLIEIFSYLPATDLIAIQRTCRTVRGIVTGTTYLQYILCLQVNGVDDSFPPDIPYSKRLELLQRYEQSWKALKFKFLTQCSANFPLPVWFTLQDGYLIYDAIEEDGYRYGYIDLYSFSPDNELHWVHITIPVDNSRRFFIPSPSVVAYAVDHNLVIIVRNQYNDLAQCAFFEFTTGTPHPLASKQIVSLPLSEDFYFAWDSIEVLGDFFLILLSPSSGSDSVLYLVSWKTGSVTLLPDTGATLENRGLKLVLISSSLIAVFKVRDSTNGLEIYKLDASPPDPHLQRLCFLEFPTLLSGSWVGIVNDDFIKEWIPTSKSRRRSGFSQGHHGLPFYSSTVTTIRLVLSYGGHEIGQFDCTMIISVAALLSAICPDVPNVPWLDWGPSCTHVIQNTWQVPAGPFWLTNSEPSVVRDYDPLRVRYARSKVDPHRAVHHEREMYSEHWETHGIETYLPYDDIPNEICRDLNRFAYIVADREWFVGIAYVNQAVCVTVYHVG